MNGLSLLDQMRADPELHEVPVLILTNHDEPENQTRAAELGPGHFLSKSRTAPDDLSRLVRRFSRAGRS